MHSFFVALYLDRQANHDITHWHEQLEHGLKHNWQDVLEFWSELYAIRVYNNKRKTEGNRY